MTDQSRFSHGNSAKLSMYGATYMYMYNERGM